MSDLLITTNPRLNPRLKSKSFARKGKVIKYKYIDIIGFIVTSKGENYKFFEKRVYVDRVKPTYLHQLMKNKENQLEFQNKKFTWSSNDKKAILFRFELKHYNHRNKLVKHVNRAYYKNGIDWAMLSMSKKTFRTSLSIIY